jgi:hypothetical protein
MSRPIGLDISAMRAEAKKEDGGAEVPIMDLNGDPLTFPDGQGNDVEVVITVAGKHSERYRRLEEKQNRQPIGKKSMKMETFTERSKELAIGCTLGWTGIGDKGVVAECTPENVRMLYDELPWVLDQVIVAMNDHSLFSKSSSPTLSST